MSNLPKPTFDKRSFSIDEQLALLKSRGMLVTSDEKAKDCLRKIGYYRLRDYMIPFRGKYVGIDIKTNKNFIGTVRNFSVGTNLSLIHELYIFDKKLRLLILDCIERIEIYFRVKISNIISKRDIFGHRNRLELNNNFAPDPRLCIKKNPHEEWLGRLNKDFERSKKDYIISYKNQYSSPLPIWMSIEIWTFGTMSVFLSGMKEKDLNEICLELGLPRRELLTSWIKTLNYIRNVCAHHSRLWNISLDVQSKTVKNGEIKEFDHFSENKKSFHKIYHPICVMIYILSKISPNSSWKKSLKDHLNTLPYSPYIKISHMGFPENWEITDLWRE